MKIEVLKSQVGDNYFYLIHDDVVAALVDPVDGAQAVREVQARGLALKWILNTHFHPDHVSGNPMVLRAFPETNVVAGAGDADAIEAQFDARGERGVDWRVHAGDEVELGGERFRVLETPGHTAGHVSFLLGRHLFSGDVVFTGGAGNCRFGGEPGSLYETFRDVLGPLPEDTAFYPGHDYAVNNAEFVLSIEPEQKEALAVLEEARKHRDAGELFQSTLGRERKYNPFMRYDEEALIGRLERLHSDRLEEMRARSADDGEAVFRCLRSLRDEW